MKPLPHIPTRVLHLIARYADAKIDLDTPVSELDIDSLAAFEIVYELEECFSLELDEETLQGVKTPRDLANAIRREAERLGFDVSATPPTGG